MQVVINGQPTSIEPSETVQDLVGRLGLTGRIAVEINRHIVPSEHFPTRLIEDGDVIEIVRAIGGG